MVSKNQLLINYEKKGDRWGRLLKYIIQDCVSQQNRQ